MVEAVVTADVIVEVIAVGVAASVSSSSAAKLKFCLQIKSAFD